MTEAEAKTKWCPFARIMVTVDSTVDGRSVGPVAVASANRFPDDRAALCVGSACMAWRKSGSVDHPTGYCGLAGEP